MAFRSDSTATYTYAANSTGGTVDLGARNNYRYVNASNVYNKGKADGAALTVTKKTISYGIAWDSGTIAVSGNVGAGYKQVFISNFKYDLRTSHGGSTSIKCDFGSYNSSSGAVTVSVYHPTHMNSCSITLACIK